MPSSPSRRPVHPAVPVFEPEVLVAQAMRRPQATATTRLGRMSYRGVVMSSQRKRALEYGLMMDVLDRIPPSGLGAVLGIGCMAPGWNFLLVIPEANRKSSLNLVRAYEARIIFCNGGHDGLLVTIGTEPAFRLQRWWEIAPEFRR